MWVSCFCRPGFSLGYIESGMRCAEQTETDPAGAADSSGWCNLLAVIQAAREVHLLCVHLCPHHWHCALTDHTYHVHTPIHLATCRACSNQQFAFGNGKSCLFDCKRSRAFIKQVRVHAVMQLCAVDGKSCVIVVWVTQKSESEGVFTYYCSFFL